MSHSNVVNIAHETHDIVYMCVSVQCVALYVCMTLYVSSLIVQASDEGIQAGEKVK